MSITAAGFKPDTVFIDRGESVKWTNNDSADHQVVLEAPTVVSPVLHPGQSFSYRFDAAQTRSYHDGTKPSMTGLVQVRGASVTLTVSALQVVYGNGVQVAGGIGPGGANQQVTIHISPYRGIASTKQVMTDADGIFQLAYTPRIRTQLFATWSGSRSEQDIWVNVRPQVVFKPISARQNLYFVRVSAARSYTGKLVRIQRLNAKRVWVTTRLVRLHRGSRARFYETFAPGRTRARAWVGAAPGYVTSFSPTRIITR